MSLTVAKPLWDLTAKYYWNRLPPKITGWIRPWMDARGSTTCGVAIGLPPALTAKIAAWPTAQCKRWSTPADHSWHSKGSKKRVLCNFPLLIQLFSGGFSESQMKHLSRIPLFWTILCLLIHVGFLANSCSKQCFEFNQVRNIITKVLLFASHDTTIDLQTGLQKKRKQSPVSWFLESLQQNYRF